MEPIALHAQPNRGLRLQLAGLGDVGGTLLTGLMLLGGGLIESVAIYDPDKNRIARYEQELNQILPYAGGKPRVFALTQDALFYDCDGFLFTASVGVPPVGSGVDDVRAVQYEKNRSILTPYARLAVERGFTGLFFQISDPVDRLSFAVLDAGFDPGRIVGCGLGVMLARADYCARKRGITNFLAHGRVYGPHGAGLVVANDTGEGYDDALSRALTQEALTANLAVRESGYKPYIAPGLSSGCITVLNVLSGKPFDGALYDGAVFFGCRATRKNGAFVPEPPPANPLLLKRIAETKRMLLDWRTNAQNPHR